MPDSTLLPKTPTTIGSWVTLIAKVLESCNIDSHALFAEAGLDLKEARNPQSRFEVHKMAKVWQLAVEKSEDPCFALRLPVFFQPNIYSALGLALASSRTLQDALERCVRYYQLTSDAAVLSLQENGPNIELLFTVPPEHEPVAVEAVEAFTATSIHLFRIMVGDDFAPQAVEYKHDKIAGQERYQEFFKCPVRFKSAETKIVFDKQVLTQDVLFANPSLTATLDDWMQRYLAQFKQDLTSTKVQAYLLEHLSLGDTDQNTVASQIGMSVRALQRKLKEEGTSFSELMDECRHQLALKYVVQPKLPLAEITYLLGFSDQSNFARAFRRWTGVTPQQYRDNPAG